MRTITIILLLFLSLRAFAPSAKSLWIERIEPIRPYERMLKAIAKIESQNGNKNYLFDPSDSSCGDFHIRPIRLRDYNQRTGNRFKMADVYNYDIAKRIVLYYISQCDYRDVKAMSIAHNGVSKRNLYYQKIQKTLTDSPVLLHDLTKSTRTYKSIRNN